jgi:hypothetical protein
LDAFLLLDTKRVDAGVKVPVDYRIIWIKMINLMPRRIAAT